MEVVIEIDGVRHKLVKSNACPECDKCSMERECPYTSDMGDYGLCEILGLSSDIHFEIEK